MKAADLKIGDIVTIEGLSHLDIFFCNDLFEVVIADDGSLVLPSKVKVISRPLLGKHDHRWLTSSQLHHVRLVTPRTRKPFAKRTTI